MKNALLKFREFLKSHQVIVGVFGFALMGLLVFFMALAFRQSSGDEQLQPIDIVESRSPVQVGREVIAALADKNTVLLADLVQDQGLSISHKASFDPSSSITLSHDKIAKIFATGRAYTWGKYEQSGMRMMLTAEQYWGDYFWQADYKSAELTLADSNKYSADIEALELDLAKTTVLEAQKDGKQLTLFMYKSGGQWVLRGVWSK